MPDGLLGPNGIAIAAVAVTGVLWRLVLQYIADLRAQRDFNAAGWRESTAATNRLADALEQANRDAAFRSRATDK